MAALKRLIPLLVLLLTIALSAPAFAQRTGGRFGGRPGFSPRPSVPTAPRSPDGPGGFFPVPIFFGPGGYGCGGGAFGGLLMLALIYFLFIRPQMTRRYRDQDREEERYGVRRASAYTLDLAMLSTAARDLQRRLAELGEQGDTSSGQGLARLLREVALEVQRRRAEIHGASLSAREQIPPSQAEAEFERLASRARTRYDVDTFSVESGKVRRQQAPEDTGKEGILQYLVLSFVVAVADKLPMPPAIHDRAALEKALESLGSVTGNQILAMEIIWTPADPNDTLTSDDLALKFPDIVSL